jgi:hypothetical protein
MALPPCSAAWPNHSQPRIVMLWLLARRLSLPDVMSFCRKVF